MRRGGPGTGTPEQLSGRSHASRLRLKSEPHRLWHVRLAGTVSGPFPTAAIAQDLVLGRLPADVEISSDRIGWSLATELPSFSGLVFPGLTDGWANERREALRRWADQRGGQDRRASGPRAEPDRRRTCSWQRTIPLRRHPGAYRAGWAAVASLGVILFGSALAAAALGHAPPVNLLLQ